MPEVAFNAPEFTCPRCHVFSQQSWSAALEQRVGTISPYSDLYWATCLRCKQRTIWYEQRLVAPVVSTAPLANPDMPEHILSDYNEARDVAMRSPRSAAGLLRLCVQKLCIELGEPGKHLSTDIGALPGKHLSTDIGALVAKGLPVTMQRAFDTVRIVGNSQLHPDDTGIDLRSDPEALSLLFTLINMIVDTQISLPLRTERYYESLPEGAREQVTKRDKALAK